MEKKFDDPALTVVVLENEDVITSSGFQLGTFAFPGFNPFGE